MKSSLKESLAGLAAEAARQDVHMIGCLVDYVGGTAACFGPAVEIRDGQGGTMLHTFLDSLREMGLEAQEKDLPGTVEEQKVFSKIMELLALWTNATHHAGLECIEGKWKWIE